MPRSPEDRVIRDSQSTLWAAMRDGLVLSGEVSQSGRWHPSRVPTPEASQAWAAHVQSSTPFGRQQSWRTLSIVPPSPNEPPTPSPPVRARLAEVRPADLNVMQVELAKDDRKRAAREAAVRKIHEAMRDLELAERM
jgi:hypothetical protein